MTALFDILAALCGVGVLVVMLLEVRLLVRMARRGKVDRPGPGDDPDFRRLVALSTLAAILGIGFLAFGAFGNSMRIVG